MPQSTSQTAELSRLRRELLQRILRREARRKQQYLHKLLQAVFGK